MIQGRVFGAGVILGFMWCLQVWDRLGLRVGYLFASMEDIPYKLTMNLCFGHRLFDCLFPVNSTIENWYISPLYTTSALFFNCYRRTYLLLALNRKLRILVRVRNTRRTSMVVML